MTACSSLMRGAKGQALGAWGTARAQHCTSLHSSLNAPASTPLKALCFSGADGHQLGGAGPLLSPLRVTGPVLWGPLAEFGEDHWLAKGWRSHAPS